MPELQRLKIIQLCIDVTGDRNTMKFKITKHLLLFLKRLGLGLLSLIVLFFLLNLLFPLPYKIEYSALVTDSKGELINASLTKDDKWRMKTELNEISPLLRKTIIRSEEHTSEL